MISMNQTVDAAERATIFAAATDAGLIHASTVTCAPVS
jgi:hypothetical protein